MQQPNSSIPLISMPDEESIRRAIAADVATEQGHHDPEGESLSAEETLEAAPGIGEIIQRELAESSIREKLQEFLDQEKGHLARAVLREIPHEHRLALGRKCRENLEA